MYVFLNVRIVWFVVLFLVFLYVLFWKCCREIMYEIEKDKRLRNFFRMIFWRVDGFLRKVLIIFFLVFCLCGGCFVCILYVNGFLSYFIVWD